MKKIAIASIIALMSVVANAIEVGVIGGETFNANNHTNNTVGLTVGQQMGKLGMTFEADHNFRQKLATNADRYSLIASYDVAKIGAAQVAVKGGVDYLSQRSGSTLPAGYGLLAGVGASVPVTNKVSATLDYRYSAGQSRVHSQNGNQILAGIKYSF